MRDGKDASVSFIEEAIRTGKVIGYKRMTEILISLRKADPKITFNDNVEIIVNEVMLDFGMTKAQLFGKKGESSLARRFCYALLKEIMSVDAIISAQYFKRDLSVIYKELCIFNKMTPSGRVDAPILARYVAIKARIQKKLTR